MENEAILSFQDRFQKEFNHVPRVDQMIVVIAFIEGLRMSNFKESLLKKRHVSLKKVNERAYKYIQIEEAAKKDEKGRSKRLMEENHRRSLNQRGGALWTRSGCQTEDTQGQISFGAMPCPTSMMYRRRRRTKGERLNT
ncbi:hypothetical protein LIER_29758 [Lithospermum erythrorhizon]|uniref:Uncharacterized protein n=1 Tax=Lithospermum erythrorhizon TaxID=34254 RepID=A0AAV3RKE6_LITER